MLVEEGEGGPKVVMENQLMGSHNEDKLVGRLKF